MDFIAVYNPKLYTLETDAWRQLLLYHSFQEHSEPIPLNEKLSLIGIIQGIWQFTHNFNVPTASSKVKYIDTHLGNGRLITVELEPDYFITFGINDGNQYPCSYYIRELCQSYSFFRMHFGPMSSFKERNELTNRLNEYLVMYWYDLNLIPEAIYSSNFANIFWHDSFKVSELKTSNSAWETSIKNNILLDDDTFLGLKDICVYKLPRDGHRHPKKYGLVRNFTTNFESLSTLSNWLYHLDRIFDSALSSHVLAGHVHLLRQGTREEDPTIDVPETTMGTKIWHNATLPISMTYDAINEVGNLTGINTFMNGLNTIANGLGSITNKIGWPNTSTEPGGRNRSDSTTHGFLISPLSLDILPESYHFRRFQLQFSSLNTQPEWYKLLFWHFKDYLCVLIFNEDFTKIWDPSYLESLDSKLYKSISILENSVIDTTVDTEGFAYAVLDKESHRIQTSLPMIQCHAEEAAGDTSQMPLKLVVNGIDDALQYLTSNTINSNAWTSIASIYSPSISSEVTTKPLQKDASDQKNSSNLWKLGLSRLTSFPSREAQDKSSKGTSTANGDSFLCTLSLDKLLELNIDLCKIYMGIQNSEYRRDSVKEEKLVKLSNGVLCYISNSSSEVVVILKNWFTDERFSKKNNCNIGTGKFEETILISSLGNDVRSWWDNRNNQD
ncbi:Ccz1p Ecym_3432 [Eremothecium cymbalariae DBVPG|uniref:CCZ1/INTU/HSP4 first Longin domain-containing protein n=1 Tax=Eremothecium cymbalariae (strain CBS 270.75 / DBVPG 7215 / KCTC 17166 / NRRL Y-17582) TaxID=931890 RepID=G8JRZ9_ERECY|nr:Hypothetical protein Ecym_3432 [Eremothecium cymbalariae DBVPG\